MFTISPMSDPSDHPTEELQELLHDRLDPEARSEVAEHLEACEPCRRELESLQRLKRLLKTRIPTHKAPASLRERVGVWSIFRNGDPDAGDAAYRLCLLRTLKTAAHETGHMLSMRHCTAYECNMCGSNHRGESDRRPIACCPECVAKICWACDADPIARYRRLAAWCRAQGLADEARVYTRFADALSAAPGPADEP